MLIATAMFIFGSTTCALAWTMPYSDIYYIWDTIGTPELTDDIKVVKIEEDVYKYTAEEISQDPSNLLSEWFYGYTVTNLLLPDIYSLEILNAHPIIVASAPASWSYDGTIGGFHTWSTDTAPITNNRFSSNHIITNFGLWVVDLYGDPTDGDHGYVPWNVNLAGGSTLTGNYRIDLVSAPVPEPASMVLLGMGILGIFGLRRKPT